MLEGPVLLDRCSAGKAECCIGQAGTVAAGVDCLRDGIAARLML
ncbi:MAG TPA: hypothetical protein VKG61_25055 [Streptosporangiaceae bacterium]|nr:hypothetical protein [Streptosporangiaceae bacterium]